MRITIELADDALQAARDLSLREHVPMGVASSTLIRRGASMEPAAASQRPSSTLRAGLHCCRREMR